MSGMRELIDTELDAVSGGHHGGITGRELPPGMHMAYSPLTGLMGMGEGNGHHGHHGHHGHLEHQGNQGTPGLFDFGNFGNFGIVNFGNIVIQENIAVQIGVAVGDNASVTNLLGSQTNLSSIAFSIASLTA